MVFFVVDIEVIAMLWPPMVSVEANNFVTALACSPERWVPWVVHCTNFERHHGPTGEGR